MLKEMQSMVCAPAIETLISLTYDHIPNERNWMNLRKKPYNIEAQPFCCLLLIVPAIDTRNSLLTHHLVAMGLK